MKNSEIKRFEWVALYVSGFFGSLLFLLFSIYVISQIIPSKRYLIQLDVSKYQEELVEIRTHITGKNNFVFIDSISELNNSDIIDIGRIEAGTYQICIYGVDTVGYEIYGIDTLLKIESLNILPLGRNKEVVAFEYFLEVSDTINWGGNISPKFESGKLYLESIIKTNYVYFIFDTSSTANLKSGAIEFDIFWKEGGGFFNLCGQPKGNNLISWGPFIYFYEGEVQIMTEYPYVNKVGLPYIYNTWYHFEVSFDISKGHKGKYSIAIDHQNIIEDVDFIAPYGHLKNLVQYSFGVGGIIEYDKSSVMIDNIILKRFK
jgi:hypothetical protein